MLRTDYVKSSFTFELSFVVVVLVLMLKVFWPPTPEEHVDDSMHCINGMEM